VAAHQPSEKPVPERKPGRWARGAGCRRERRPGKPAVQSLEAFAAAPADVKVPFGRRRPDLPVLVEDEVVVAKMLQPVDAVGMSSFILESIRRRGL
jgi:hypothetical protein